MSELSLDEALALDATGSMQPESRISLSPLRRDFLLMARTISEDGAVEALSLSEEILDRSRSGGERDPEVEARVRLDRALIGAVEEEKVGHELRWATDRLATLRPPWHPRRGDRAEGTPGRLAGPATSQRARPLHTYSHL